MTRFQVLAKDASGYWSEHSTQDAHNARAAITAAYMKHPEGALEMVAVPARSWKPMPIRTETKTKVILGAEAKSE